VRSRFSAWMLFLCLCIFPVSIFIFAQNASAQTRPSQPQVQPRDSTTPEDEDEARARLTSEMAKKAAKERVAAIKHDTDKLLKLSVELKQSVDKSDENVLSLDVIKKAEEIEKLAHSVKEKMKGPN
jgi:hypothetical protein